MTVTQAARVLGVHHETVTRYARDGRIEQNEDGTFESEAVIALDEELRAKRVDPAVDQLKETNIMFRQHFEKMTGVYLDAHSRILTMLETQNRILNEQNLSLQKSLIAKENEYRRVLDTSAERQALETLANKQGENAEKFLGIFKTAAERYFGGNALESKLKEFMNSIELEQLDKLSSVLSKSQRDQLFGLMKALPEEDNGEPH